MSCKNGVTEEEYCNDHPDTDGCSRRVLDDGIKIYKYIIFYRLIQIRCYCSFGQSM